MRKDTVSVGWDQEEFIADVSHYFHTSCEILSKQLILRNLPVIPLNEKNSTHSTGFLFEVANIL